jgi:predicted amidohydrolase YtcJ
VATKQSAIRKAKSIGNMLAVLMVLSGTSPLAAQARPESVPAAELIFLGDHILTMDTANAGGNAVAVGGGRILAVGDRDSVLELRAADTRVIELGRQALLPGFIDAHGHVGTQARLMLLANLSPPPVGTVDSLAELQEALRQYLQAQELPAGKWLVGFGYDDSLLAEQRHPTRDELDAVAGERPIFLMHASGHLGVVNSAALDLLGINADSADPPGGVIRRRAGSREPDGVLEESAALAVYLKLPKPDESAALQQLVDVQEYYASRGITTVQEGSATAADLALLGSADAQNQLLLDFVAYAYWQADKAPLPELQAVGKYQGRFKLAGIKLSLDGSPQGKTAYLSEPYFLPPHGQGKDYRGYPAYPAEQVEQAVLAVLQQGWQLQAHANGDAAAGLLIDAVEQAVQQLGVQDRRVVMIHAQTVREDQLDRMAALGMIPSFFSAHTFFWGDWHRESVLGPLRADRISPTRSALERGIRFTLHNDAPVTPPSPLAMLWSATTRRTRSNDILGPAQRVSTLEAIKGLTINAAYQYFEEDHKGSITPGKLADLVLLSDNPLTVDPEDLRNIEVMATWSHGVQVFAAPD